MLKHLAVGITVITTLLGCTAYEYGYSSLDYEEKLVNLNSEWGKKRLRQIVDYDKSAMNLISLGYKPEYLYEVSDDDFYMMGSSGYYHFERPLIDTNSTITKLGVVPPFLTKEFQKYGIQYPLVAAPSSEVVTLEAGPISTVQPADLLPAQPSSSHDNAVLSDPIVSASEVFEKRNVSVLQILAANQNARGEIDPKSIVSGSGVMISPHLLVTNYHVIEGNNQFLSVKSSISKEDSIWRLYKYNAVSDIAILKTNSAHHYVREFKRLNRLKIGQKVYAIGSPKGLKNTFSEGLVSGIRVLDDQSVIQTTASITFGSSGGGLFDEYGDLVGITSFGKQDGANLNFAMPMDAVLEVLRQTK
jgi:hypothetical protein